MTTKELQKEVRRLAKMADQRMVRLEAAARTSGYKGVKEFAYKRAQRDISTWDKKAGKESAGAPRFNRNMPTNYKELMGKYNDIVKFLEAPTSTVGKRANWRNPKGPKTEGGIEQMYKKRADALNKKYKQYGGSNITWKDLAKFFESGAADKINGQYGSDVMMVAIRHMKTSFNKKAGKAIKADASNIKKTDPTYEIMKKVKQIDINPEEVFS